MPKLKKEFQHHIERLHSRQETDRHEALAALGSLGTKADFAVESLRSSIGYEDGKVYRAMSEALDNISRQK